MFLFLKKNKKIIFLLVLGLIFLVLGILLQEKKTLNITKNGVEIDNKNEEKVLEDDKEKIVEKDPNKRYVTIVKVIDGDTIETDKGERIRYIGINAPERGQPKSTESFSLNKELVLDKEVGLEFDIQDKDRYGRTLAYVFTENIFVNLEMVRKGLAVSETIQPNVKYQDKFVNAQKITRENCLGIWEGLCGDSSRLGERTDSCVYISSVNADAVGDDNKNKNGEWVEIKNMCSENVLMENWLLKDNSASNEYKFKDFVLEANKMMLLYSGCGQDLPERLYWQCPEGKYAIWNNSGDHAFLYDEKGSLVSDFEY